MLIKDSFITLVKQAPVSFKNVSSQHRRSFRRWWRWVSGFAALRLSDSVDKLSLSSVSSAWNVHRVPFCFILSRRHRVLFSTKSPPWVPKCRDQSILYSASFFWLISNVICFTDSQLATLIHTSSCVPAMFKCCSNSKCAPNLSSMHQGTAQCISPSPLRRDTEIIKTGITPNSDVHKSFRKFTNGLRSGNKIADSITRQRKRHSPFLWLFKWQMQQVSNSADSSISQRFYRVLMRTSGR